MGTCPLTELNIVDIDRTSEDPATCQAFCRLEIKYWCRQLINQLSIHQSYIYKLFFRATAGCNFFTHFDNICYLVTSCDTIQTCQVQSMPKTFYKPFLSYVWMSIVHLWNMVQFENNIPKSDKINCCNAFVCCLGLCEWARLSRLCCLPLAT